MQGEAEQKKKHHRKAWILSLSCIFHHAGRLWTDAQHRGLNDEQCKEKAKVTPKKARNLRARTAGHANLKGGNIRAGDCHRPVLANVRTLEKRIVMIDAACTPQGLLARRRKRAGYPRSAQEDRCQHDEAWIREGYIPAWIRERPPRHQIRLRLE